MKIVRYNANKFLYLEYARFHNGYHVNQLRYIDKRKKNVLIAVDMYNDITKFNERLMWPSALRQVLGDSVIVNFY